MNIEDTKNITILGAGVMGNTFAQVFAGHGYDVRLWSRTHRTLDRALGRIRSTLQMLVEFGRLSGDEIPSIMSRISPTTDLSKAAKGAQFVLETVSEVPDIKRELFSELNNLCSKDTVLASNTSGLDIFNIARVDNPSRLIITHWFSPAHIIPLVEIVAGEETSQEVVAFTWMLMERLGKKPILLKKFVPAFIVNRVQNAINKAVFEMIDNRWATPQDIDLAIKYTHGIRLPIVGVAQVLDFNGLDLIRDINEQLEIKSAFIEEKVKQGRLGAKTGTGIYDYGGRSEAEILKKRDELYFKMLDHLKKINAFEPV